MPEESASAIRQVGRYSLFEAIGHGGMASVHLAVASGPGGFARVVAIKQADRAAAHDRDMRGLLREEARIAALVRHPNVVAVHDLVEDKDDVFLVMDYVDGLSIGELMGKLAADGDPPPPPALAVTLIADVLQGLHAAHEVCDDTGASLGIVHRDVSPRNVLVGADGVARLSDFGIAKVRDRLYTTRSGDVKGTLAYMAPEQLRGEEVTRRVDVYGAAVVLWEMLTGKPLFAAENPGRVVERVLFETVRAPSAETAIPAGLDAVVLRALSRAPSERPANALEFQLALTAVVNRIPSREVAAWLQTVSGETLATRRNRVAELQQGSRDALSPAVAGGSPARDQGVPRVRRAGLLAACALGVTVGGAALAAAYQSHRPSALPRGQAPQSIPQPPPTLMPSVASDPVEAAGSALRSPETLPERPVPKPTSGGGRTSRPPSTKARPDCDPPYTRDAAGKIVFKRHCL